MQFFDLHQNLVHQILLKDFRMYDMCDDWCNVGKHEIKKMIGDEIKLGGRFIGRVHTGEIFPI